MKHQKAPGGLGPLVSIHVVPAAQLQRVVFIAVLSFLFFLATMFVYYLVRKLGYFLLATAFLLTYFLTMFSLLVQRRMVVRVHENGLQFRNFTARWDEIGYFSDTPPYEIRTTAGRKAVLPGSLSDSRQMLDAIRARVARDGG